MANDSIPPLRRCTKCLQEFPATPEYFFRRTASKSGLQAVCRECASKYYTQRNRAKGHKPKNYLLIEGNERRCIKCHQWKTNTPEYFYRDASKADGISPICKTCANTQKQNWRANNPDKVRAGARRDWLRNIEVIRERARLFVRNNPHKVKVHYQKRQARKRSLPDTLTQDEWQRTLEYFNGCCAVCKRPPGLWHTLAMDHWIPVAHPECPGTVRTNAVPLCHGIDGCNNSKGNKLPAEWLTEKYGARKGRAILKRIQTYLDNVK